MIKRGITHKVFFNMETKLTLSIESGLAQTAKSYAKKKGHTL